jgi:hypothetical protein
MADNGQDEDAVALPAPRYVFRRQTSKLEFEFVDDRTQVLGVMTRRLHLLNGTTTTEVGSFRSIGTGFNHRMEDCRTGERILGRRVGWRLPNGEKLTVRISSALRLRNKRFRLRSFDRTVVVELSWLPPLRGRGRFSYGQAEFAAFVQPSVELVPLLSYAFQRFQIACSSAGG